VVAALTPPDVGVQIMDEYVVDIDFDTDADLIGITAMTTQAERAYQIADEFRRRGKTVVMGGMHVSALPEEAAKHCDAVVVGEAELLWGRVIKDLQSGCLDRIYQTDQRHNLRGLPLPRLDLLRLDRYRIPMIPVQTSRGCQHRCDFCMVTQFFGGTHRFRPVEEVVREIEIQNAKISGKSIIFFADDNIAANRRHAKELFKALIPLNVHWSCQCTLNVANDPELLELAVESGCTYMFIGIETTNVESLKSVNKDFNRVEKYEQAIETLYRKGICVEASMIVGFDEDKEDIFDDVLAFLTQNKVSLAAVWILTPLPGTPLFKRLETEGRLFHTTWSKYTYISPVFKPKHIDPETLEKGLWHIYDRFYSLRSICGRLLFTPKKWVPLAVARNMQCRHNVRRRMHPMAG
jgi:radical SAM superfamily enzyme YgiQ (UPF0313 family)